MIYPNKPSRKYEAWVENLAAITRTDIAFAATDRSVMTFTWGNAFSPTHGIRVTLDTYYLGGDATGYYEAKLEAPWGASMTLTAHTGLVADLQSYLAIDGAVFTLHADCTWSFTFTEIRWYCDIGDGAGMVLRQTIAGRTDTGSGYDGRLNDFRYDSQTTSNLVPAGVPTLAACAANYAAEATYSLVATTTTIWDWRWDQGSGWMYPDILIDSLTPPAPVVPGGCSGCDCVMAFPTMLVGTVWPRGSINSEVIVRKEKHDYGEITCHCPPGTIEARPGIFDVWSTTLTYQNQQSDIIALPKDAGMTTSTKLGKARCWCVDPPPSFTISSTTGVDVDTFAEFDSYASQVVNVTTCFHVVQLGLCALPEDGGSIGISTPCFGVNHSCAYDGVLQLTHPDPPPCSSAIAPLPYHLQRLDKWSHWTLAIAGDIWVKTADHVVPVAGWRTSIQVTSSGDCSRPRLRFESISQRLVLTYYRSGIGPYTAYSDDDGATWSAPAPWP